MKESSDINNLETFYDWCITKYEKRDDAAGDLARDIKSDIHFPRTIFNKCIILDYLRHRRACNEALRAFYCVWKRYEKEVLNKKSL